MVGKVEPWHLGSSNEALDKTHDESSEMRQTSRNIIDKMLEQESGLVTIQNPTTHSLLKPNIKQVKLAGNMKPKTAGAVARLKLRKTCHSK